MVQLKYFGDDRDYFKYDLITEIVKKTSLRQYVFVPMLTEHRHDNEGKIKPKECSYRRKELFEFINNCPNKSLAHWERWLRPSVSNYQAIEPVDRAIFSNETRTRYWKKCGHLIEQEHTLVFLDPDTGLQLGRKTRIKEMHWPKYILNEELDLLVERLHPTSAFLIYQHLPRNMHFHQETVNNKIQLLNEKYGLKASAYREGDLAFIALTKTAQVHHEIERALTKYYEGSRHQHKSIHF